MSATPPCGRIVGLLRGLLQGLRPAWRGPQMAPQEPAIQFLSPLEIVYCCVVMAVSAFLTFSPAKFFLCLSFGRPLPKYLEKRWVETA